jgi:hypothetical protein
MEAIGRSSLKNYTVIFDSKPTKFWEKGFEILQNINDSFTFEKEMKRAKDPIFLATDNEKLMKTDCK